MGKLINGIHGPFKGKVGNVVGTFWKGISVMRVIPADRIDANTNLQQAQRAKLKLLSSFLQRCNKLVNLGFTAIDPKLSAFNNAMKHNYQIVEGTFPEFRLNIENLKLSMGKLENLWDPTITAIDSKTIQITWNDNTDNMNAFATDQLHLCVVDKESYDIHKPSTNVTRNAGTCLLVLPNDWSGHDVYVIGFMAKEGVKGSKSMKDVSNSQVWEVKI